MKRFFKIEKPSAVSSWSSKLIGIVFPLTWEGEHFVEVQAGSGQFSINKKQGSIITEKELTQEQIFILNIINHDD